METVTYTLNTRTPAGGYQIMITSSGVMLWAVTLKRGWGFFFLRLLGVLYNQTFIPLTAAVFIPSNVLLMQK